MTRPTFCDQCGARVGMQDAFCRSCGTRVQDMIVGGIVGSRPALGGTLAIERRTRRRIPRVADLVATALVVGYFIALGIVAPDPSEEGRLDVDAFDTLNDRLSGSDISVNRSETPPPGFWGLWDRAERVDPARLESNIERYKGEVVVFTTIVLEVERFEGNPTLGNLRQVVHVGAGTAGLPYTTDVIAEVWGPWLTEGDSAAVVGTVCCLGAVAIGSEDRTALFLLNGRVRLLNR